MTPEPHSLSRVGWELGKQGPAARDEEATFLPVDDRAAQVCKMASGDQ